MPWPNDIVPITELYFAVDLRKTALTNAIDDSQTSFDVDNPALPSPGILLIVRPGTPAADCELVRFTSINGSTLEGITRGWSGTTPSAAVAGSEVHHVVAAEHHNKVVDEIVNIETDLKAHTGTGDVVNVSTSTLLVNEKSVNVDATAGPVTITLPPAATKRFVTVRKVDASANAVTVQGDVPAATINGAATHVLSVQYESYDFEADVNNTWGVV